MSVVIVSLVLFCTSVNYVQTIDLFLSEKTENDTLLEIFHNCNCTLYSACSYTNTIMMSAQTDTSENEKVCSNPDYICCSKLIEPSERHVMSEIECGVAKTEIGVRILTPEMDSAATIPGEVPWMVEIFKRNPKNTFEYRCSGALIHPKVVLTVTHCIRNVQPQNLKIIVSGKETFQKIGVDPTDETNIAKIISHPNYNYRYLYNDISLLILQTEFSFQHNRLNSICLPSTNQNFNGRRCIATGWHQDKQLKVDLPIIGFQQCKAFLKTTKLGRSFNLHESFTCAGGEQGKDTCKGDGGAPLVCLGEEYRFVLTGMVSWGLRKNCGVAKEPGVYVNVAKFVDWIRQEVRKEGLTIN